MSDARGEAGGRDAPRDERDAGFDTKDAEVFRVRRRLARRAAQVSLSFVLLPVVAALGLGAAGAITGSEMHSLWDLLITLGPLCWVPLAPIAAIVSLVASLQRKLPARALSVRDRAIKMPGAGALAEIRPGAVEGAIVRASTLTDHEAEIALRSGDVLHVRVKDRGPKGPDELVEALGFSGAKRKTVVALGGARSPLWSALAAVVLGLVLAPISTCATVTVIGGPSADGLLLPVMGIAFVLVTAVAARLMTPRRLVVGADGVELHGPLRRRFFPRSRIFGVGKIEGRASLFLHEGDGVTQLKLSAEDRDRREGLVNRIREALEDSKGEDDPRSALLARGEDTIQAWRDRVAKLVAPSEGYRRSSIPTETLLSTITDAGAPRDVRVGAAMALGSTRDASAREQLRIATEAIVDEDLRAALEVAAEAEAEESALQAALARATRR